MKYDFNKASRIISVDCFPVDKLWLVYSEGPKKFKTKIHAIAACFLSDDMNSLVFRAITTMDIDAGFVLDLNEGLDKFCDNNQAAARIATADGARRRRITVAGPSCTCSV